MQYIFEDHFGNGLKVDFVKDIPVHFGVFKKEGKIIEGWQKMTEVSYIPKGYKNAEELQKIQKLAFRKFYFRPGYVFKRIASIRSFNDVKRNYNGLKFLLGIF